MTTDAQTYADFLKDVGSHQLHIERDDGLYRHLRFSRPGTYCMSFQIVTWPGYLAYVGDMGSYTFTRVQDMFEFFRVHRGENPQTIDRRYWAEKCTAMDKSDGIEQFSRAMFNAALQSRFDEYAEDRELDAEAREALWDEIVDWMPSDEDADESECYKAAMDFEHERRFPFQDFYEHRCREFTTRFTWCCHALRWGIWQYDQAKQAQPA